MWNYLISVPFPRRNETKYRFFSPLVFYVVVHFLKLWNSLLCRFSPHLFPMHLWAVDSTRNKIIMNGFISCISMLLWTNADGSVVEFFAKYPLQPHYSVDVSEHSSTSLHCKLFVSTTHIILFGYFMMSIISRYFMLNVMVFRIFITCHLDSTIVQATCGDNSQVACFNY